MTKEQYKDIQLNIAWWIFKVWLALNHKATLNFRYASGWLMGKFFYWTINRHRNAAVENLKQAFPDMTIAQCRKLASSVFTFFCQSVFELFYFLDYPHKSKNIQVEGADNLDKALESGRGVIMITAHFGNFPLIVHRLLTFGYKINIVLRPLRQEKAGEYLYTLLRSYKTNPILSYPREECLRNINQALRKNEIVIILMDQNFGTGGVWVKFFNKLAATPIGPVVLALRSKAAVVPVHIVREGKGRHRVIIEPALELVRTSDIKESVLLNAIKITRIIESWVRSCPGQWAWIHRRWKSQPSSEVMSEPFLVEK
jgi:Kdo2-lipid IVA lauroyltransferase/acyltransferase